MDPKQKVPEFLSVGHVTHDRINGRIRLGGAALYSALTAHRLGKKTAVLTSYGRDYAGQEVFNGISTRVLLSDQTSTFRNLYEEHGRVQRLYGSADPLCSSDMPAEWRRSQIVYLCPVLHEVAQETGWSDPESLVGVAPQGWLRRWDKEGKIECRRWQAYEGFLGCAGFLIASEKDIEGNENLVEAFRKLIPIVVITRAEKGAEIFTPEKTLILDAYPAQERDPTGAGDCFGAAFLIRYRETGDLEAAARFASCVGSFVVEKDGINGIPSREEVICRMKEHSLACREMRS